MTIEILLTRGQIALIDDQDANVVCGFSWHAKRANGDRQNYYAATAFRSGLRLVHMRMHRMILGVGPEAMIDHRNGNGLDNRRANLRLCDFSGNAANRIYTRAPKSGFKGVFKNHKKWGAKIKAAGREFFLGNFLEKEDAARAYDVAAREHFGEFARLNFPEAPP